MEGDRRTFTSQCELSALICSQNSDFKYIQDGPCCAARCSLVDKKEGETKIFPNECEVGAWNCSQGTGIYFVDFVLTFDDNLFSKIMKSLLIRNVGNVTLDVLFQISQYVL